MFFRIVIIMNTKEQLKKLINEADAIVIGAGAGLSTAAGFVYGGDYFLENFSDINKKYGYTDMYSAGFHNFKTLEEKWGYWSRFIYLQRYKEGAKKLYCDLLKVFKDKNYFVLTTNVDHQFQLAGFDKNRLFYTQGDYGLFQCEVPCHNKTYDNYDSIMKMIKEQKDGIIPTSLIPVCPVCGKRMTTNLRSDDSFVEDEGWVNSCKNYENFLNRNSDKKVLFLELGVGFNTPGIIKYPFIKMTYAFKDAFYVCMNLSDNYIPEKIKDKALQIDEDIKSVVEYLLN